MNALSWMIYLAGVVGSLGGFVLFVAVATTATGIFCLIAFTVPWTKWSWEDKAEWDAKMAIKAKLGGAGKRLLVVAVIAGGIGSLIPDSRTVYMIAASEAGEKVVSSPDAIEMMASLKALIKKRLTEELAR